MLMHALDRHNNARAVVHHRLVKTDVPSPPEVLATNLKALMDKREWTQTQVALKGSVSQSHVGNILRKNRIPSIKIIDKVARAFGLPGWLLLVPGLSPEILDSPHLPLLVSFYVGAGNQDAREAIFKYAEREFVHASHNVLPFSKK